MKSIYFVCLILLLSLVGSPAYSNPAANIETLKNSDLSQLERQRNIVARIVRENFGDVRLQGATNDLYYLQKIVDKKLVPKNDGFDLQALGVILGDVMVKNLDLNWVTVDDSYGRSRALRYEDTKSLFFPITMISRRVRAGLPVNVRDLYKNTEASVKALTYERSKYRPLPKPKFNTL